MWMLFLVPVAAAYNLSGTAWPDDALPLEIHWTGSQEGFTHAELEALVHAAGEAWTNAGPSTFGIEVVEDADADAWFRAGGNAVLFGDPDDALADGLLETMISGAGGGAPFERNGRTFTESPPVEIVYNNGEFWTSDSAVASGACTTGISLQATLTHDLGHVLGLAHSCEQGDACTDADARSATMYWSMSACDASPSTLGSDDIEGLQAIYGVAFALDFSCTASADGMGIACAATEPADVASLNPVWDFGDGGTAAGAEASHTYAVSGTYAVELCVQPPDDSHARCETQSFVAEPSADSGTDTALARDTNETAPPECGCASVGDTTSSIGALLVLLGLTARRRGA
jgi:hypothetical protein